MSKAIEFLERVGRDARLRYASEAELRDALEHAQLTPAVSAAILRANRHHVEARLSATANTFCGLLGATANTSCVLACCDDQDHPAGYRPLADPAESSKLGDAHATSAEPRGVFD